VALATLLCALLLQIGTNLANDFYDAKSGVDGGDRLGPIRMTTCGFISPEKMRMAFVLSFGLALIIGIFLMVKGGIPIVIIGLSSLFVAWAYTGGPIPLSHYGLGEILAFVFFGPIAASGTFLLQYGRYIPDSLIIGIGPGLIAAVLMGVNNLRDRQQDKLAKKYTLAVILPEKIFRLFLLVLVLLSWLIPTYIAYLMEFKILFLGSIPTLIFWRTWKNIWLAPIDKTFNQNLGQVGQYMLLYCLLNALPWIFVPL